MYARRVIDNELDELQPHLPAVSIFGPKAVGKTETARQRVKSALWLDSPEDVQRLRADPGLLGTLPGPVLLDEWQRVPEVWDSLRRQVDAGAPAGRFVLTGSSAPRDLPVHSGAGRIAGLRMRPMTLAERGVGQGAVSLKKLLAGDAEISGETEVDLGVYVREIVSSGFPGIRSKGTPRLIRAQLDSYIDAIVQREFADQGYPVRRPEAVRAWLAGYAAAVSTTAKYVEILDAATPNQAEKPSAKTTVAYRDVLDGLWQLDPTPAWLPQESFLSQLGQASKHQLADPALAARLLRLDEESLLRGRGPKALSSGRTTLGRLFESLATLCVRPCAQAAEAATYHLREKHGRHEVDLVVEGLGGRVVAFEVKLTATPHPEAGADLRWLRSKIGDRLAAAVMLTTGRLAYRRPDGIAVVPLALLGP